MNFDAHITKWDGEHISQYGGECVANAAMYCANNGKPIAYANAKDWFNHPALTGAFDFITNNPTDYNQVPLRGDIIIWNGYLAGSGDGTAAHNPANGTGYGHIAIYDARVSPGVFRSFDQNWGGNYCHMVTHNYNNVQGWMRPKATAPSTGGTEVFQNDQEVKEAYVFLRGNEGTPEERKGWIGQPKQRFFTVGLPEANGYRQQRADIQAQLNIVNAKVNEQNQAITKLSSDVNLKESEKAALVAQIADCNAELTTAHDKIKDLENNPDTQILNDTGNVLTRLFNRLFKRG